jgi:hypothetical protein
VGNLWIPNEMDPTQGTLLGSVTFTNETDSGWQPAFFQAPIRITAHTTYVVSYFVPFTPERNYALDPGFFASGEIVKDPLRALQDSDAEGNGVFRYSDSGGLFPNETPPATSQFNAPNYWVDVIFGNTAVSPPQVLSTTPAPGAIGIPIGDPITVTFSEPIDPDSVTNSVLLTDTAGASVLFDTSFGPGNFTITLTPQQPLQSGQAYTVTLKGGDDEPHITDATGIPLAADFTWSFITEQAPAPVSTEVKMHRDRVTFGANFIAMRPDKQHASLLSLNYASSVLSRLLKPAL